MRETSLLIAMMLLFAGSAFGATYRVGIYVDCNPGIDFVCFSPTPLTIQVGDAVTFFIYRDDSGQPHNVAADDGSFRCASGCDGEGGDGTPAGYATQWSFTRTFMAPGIVHYHDEGSAASGVIVVQSPAPEFTIGPGITGAWYDPVQSGHGLLVEVLPDNRFYASWFTFNPAGTQQAWFTGVGSYSGNTATIPAVQMPTGGHWIPSFDPSQVERNAWGTLDFVFTDCDHGIVSFSSVAGYGTGSMNLTRLTQPAGLNCP